jgi:DNA-binding PadR family transcriptional regulator
MATRSFSRPGGRAVSLGHGRRAVVYRALRRLAELGLLAEAGTECTSQGPARTVVRATPAGESAVRRWLTEPVGHVRDVRSALMIKLALLDRAGADASGLLEAQRAVVVRIVAALRTARVEAEGFDRTLADWRYETAVATLAFLDDALRR